MTVLKTIQKEKTKLLQERPKTMNILINSTIQELDKDLDTIQEYLGKDNTISVKDKQIISIRKNYIK